MLRLFAFFIVILGVACINILPVKAAEPAIRLHYLGHSSFLIRFDNGVSILTDYGFSRSFGLPSPIYDLGGFQPTIVTYSHNHQDHDRGEVFDTPYELRGKGLCYRGIEIKPILTSEGYKNSNVSYLIIYKGFTVLHLGDAQGDIVNIDKEEERQLLKGMFPERIDLLLIPIGWTKDILKESEAAVEFFHPKRVVPMHYWYKETKQKFLDDLRSKNSSDGLKYDLHLADGPEYDVSIADSGPEDTIQVISLEPKAFTP